MVSPAESRVSKTVPARVAENVNATPPGFPKGIEKSEDKIMTEKEKNIDVTALGELLIDFTESGNSPQGNALLEVNPGGAPCNVLAMLSRLQRKTCFIGKVGQDMFGNLLEEAIRSVGIDASGLKKDPEVHTTLAFVHTLEGGDREFSFYRNPGADMMLQEEDVDLSLIQKARIFHFGTLSMTHPQCRKATQRAIRAAQESGCILSFDPNLREPLWSDLSQAHEQTAWGMERCHILKISDNEIRWFTGEEDFLNGLKILEERFHIPLILLSLGKEGSMAYTEDTQDPVFVPAFENPHTVETTGAGDTFCACVLHYILKQLDQEPQKTGFPQLKEEQLREMLTFANAAASIVTTRKGALKIMPSPSEVYDFIEQSGRITDVRNRAQS